MNDLFSRITVSLTFVLAATVLAGQVETDFSGYRTVQTAITTALRTSATVAAGSHSYLGLALETDKRGKLIVTEVAENSPAFAAGAQKNDLVLKVAGKSVKSADEARALLQAKAPGETVKLSLQRGRKTLELTATLAALSRPLKIGDERAVLGVRMGAVADPAGIAIFSVTTNKPAWKAGLKSKDIILSVNGAELGEGASLTDKLSEFRPGDAVTLRVRRGQEEFERRITLVADDSVIPPEEQRVLKPWQKSTYRLAVLRVEFPDAKHNDQIATKDWEDAYFSRGTYTATNATGQKTYGSMADYYHEISCGKLKVEGRVFDWVELPKKRAEYNGLRAGLAPGFFSNIVAAVTARDGRDALKGFDGLAVIYAGERAANVSRGSLLWAHRSSVTLKGRSWPYVLVSEGGKRMASISTMCHETGHILGLPDLYARPENPGSEGAGTWCAMSNQSPNGRPQHFSAWCKEQLGWLNPVVIDPTVKQKLLLAPVENSTNECFKVLVRPDGSEYFLLENRRRKGFDASLPAEGLLIWRVVANRPILEEAHGVEGPAGPRVYLSSVPFPSKSNTSFTPHTTPSSRPQLGGGLPVFISNIQQLPDGRIAFQVGYEFE